MPATTLPLFTSDEWAVRLLRLFSKSFSSESAREFGAILYSVFKSLGSQYAYLQTDELLEAFNAGRISTATGDALDLVANDYFGATPYYPASVVRTPGESDDSLRARIVAGIFIGGGTRSAMFRILSNYVGSAPRIVEPWYVGDCACLDAASYVDIDTPENPTRVSDSGMRGAMFVESALPSFGGQGNNPVYGLDEGLAADFGFCIDPQPSWFQGEVQLDALIQRIKTLGIKVYRKYLQQPTNNTPIGGSSIVDAGADSTAVILYPPMSGEFMVIAQASWNTNISWAYVNDSQFNLVFSEPPPEGGLVDWLVAPLFCPGFTLGYADLEDPTGEQLIVPEFSGGIPLIQTTWQATAWITNLTHDRADFSYSDPPPPSSSRFAFAIMPASSFGPISGAQDVDAASTEASIFLPSWVTGPYQAFLTPTWNTQIAVTKFDYYFQAVFSVPPPVNGKLYWAIKA